MKPLTEDDISHLWSAVQSSRKAALSYCGPSYRAEQIAFANAVLAKFGGGPSEADVKNIVRRIGLYASQEPVGLREDEIAMFAAQLLRPLAPAPRTVTLSMGSTFRSTPGGILAEWEVQRKDDGAWCPITGPCCVTVADFEACAALLRETEP